MIFIIAFYFVSVIYCQTVPTTFVAKTVPLQLNQLSPVYPKVIYNSPAHGQRIDTFRSTTDSAPFQTAFYGLTKNNYLFYNYNDMKYDSPLCFEFGNRVPPFTINLLLAFGSGIVNGEVTSTFLGPYNNTWFQVVSNTRYYYPRAYCDISTLTLFTDFNIEVPDESVWDIPVCFPSIGDKLKLDSAPPAAPFPNAFTFTQTYITDPQLVSSIKTAVDTTNNRTRMTWIINYTNPSYATMVYDILNIGEDYYYLSTWGDINPIPCIDVSPEQPTVLSFSGIYYGTVTLRNQSNTQFFNIYEQQNTVSSTYYAFENTTNSLKAIYSWGINSTVTYWNATAPDPSTWVIPTKCYQVFRDSVSSTDINANNLGASFTSSFTIKFLAPDEHTLYYNALTQMWRHDTFSSVTVQKGNIQYKFNNAFYDSGSTIKPPPCSMSTVPFAFPFGFPTNYPNYYGAASYKGTIIDVWYGNNTISYWNANIPIFFLGSTCGPLVIVSYVPGPPTTDKFDTPAQCAQPQNPK